MPDFAPISLDQTQPIQEQPLQIAAGVQASPISPDIADQRAVKASYGLADVISTSYPEFYQRFIAGQEPQVRANAAAALDVQKAKILNKVITETAAKTGPLLPEEMDKIKGMVAAWKPSDPSSVIEDAFSVKAVNNIYTVNGGLDTSDDRPYSWLEDAMREIPTVVSQEVRKGSVYSSKIEFAKTLRQNIQGDIDNQSYVGWTLDQAKSFFQPYQEAKLRGNTPIDIWGGLGTSLEEQGKALLRMSPEDYKINLTNIVNNLKKDNPSIAAKFLDAVIGESQQGISIDNAFTLLAIPDAVTGTKLAASLFKKAILTNATRIAVKDIVKGLDNASTQPIKTAIADAAGDLSEAAIQKEVVSVAKGMKGVADPSKDALEALQSIMKISEENIAANPGRFGQEIVNRLRESYSNFKTDLFSTIERMAKVDRITPALATEAGIRAIQQEIKETYPGLRNSILNISQIYSNKTGLITTYHADIIIGKPDGSYFLQKQVADNYMKVNGLAEGSYTLKQKGLGWYGSVTKPVNETTHAVRDFLTATESARSPNSWFSAFAGMLRTPEETLAHEQLMNRKIATYAPSELMKVAKDTARPIEKLAKWTIPGTAKRARWNEWERAVKFAQDDIDPLTAQKGYFKASPGELEELYMQKFKRLPEQGEVEAYFAFKRLGEMDHVLRNLSIYRNMSRVGAENHTFFSLDAYGQKMSSKTFQAVSRKEFPGGEGTTLVINERHGTEELFTDGVLQTKRLNELKAGIKDGTLKIVEVYDPELRPFENYSPVVKGERIRYVISKTGKMPSSQLDYNNLPYKGGGHFEYDYEHYIKQAKIRPERVGKSVKNWYEGDTTIMPMEVRAMGTDVANKMNAVRVLIKNKDIQGAKELAARTLPIEWDKFYGWFKPSRDLEGKIVGPRLSLNEPFHVVPRGKNIRDLGDALEARYTNPKTKKSTFEDGTRKGSLARQYQVQYTAERDAYDMISFKNEGTSTNPLYKIQDPSMLDPIPTMNRALSRITNSFFMDDYKISAIEHWLTEAAPFLKPELAELRYAPFHYFNNLSQDSWRSAADPAMVKQLTTRHYQIKQFTGTASSTEALMHSLGQKLADSIYTRFGPEGLKIPLTNFKIEPADVLARITDPVKFVRSLTFHAKLGLFAIPQFLVQSQTFVTIAGISGFSKAIPGTFATLLHQWSRLNPQMIEALDKYATRMHIPGTSRWRPGEFKEAWTELKNTGFANVAGEYALRDDLMSHKVIGTGKDAFLDAGAFFFREGEKNVRLGAWYTAYREFRDINPLGKITNTERKAILDRATLLNVNMDRSSNSVLQHGAFSIPTQFLTYQIRAAELFLGKRLSMIDRARLFGTYAAVYGVPTATGVFGYPFGDNLRKAAIDNGYKVGENYLSTLMEGIPATMFAAATGGGDISKGNWLNIGERYGSQGFTSIRDAIQGDRTVWDLMGGAAFSTLANTWTQSDGFRTAMIGYIRNDPGFKMKPSDAADIFKEISSFNSAWRLWAAINTGRWMTKTEQWASDVTPLNAVFNTLTGLQDQNISDARTKSLIKKDEKALADYSQKKFVEEFQRSLHEEDPKQKQDFMSRAFAWLKIGGFPEHRYGQAISIAAQDNENLISRTDWNFATKDVPQTKTRMGLPYGAGTRENVPQQRYQDLGKTLQMKGQQ